MSIVHIDVKAEDDLAAIARYIGIEKQNPRAARDLVEEFYAKCESYAHQPLMGDARPDLDPEVRSFTFKKNYVAIYEPLDDGINVVRVFHGAQDYQKQFRHGRT
ncbi:MAG: type II toxin-antitoxin system RelE/ParE family toxin [Haloechinothrix sp.]